MDKVWFSGFKYHVNLVCHAQHIFTHLISTQSSVRVSIVTQDFSATNFKIFKRKNRREVFGVSSENILHLTFPRYSGFGTKLSPFFGFAKSSKDKTNFPLSQLPSLLVACVGKSVFYLLQFSV